MYSWQILDDPAKTNLSWLVDNPIDTKRLFWISETTHLRSTRIPYPHFLNPIQKSYCWWLSLPIVDGYTRNPIPTHDDDPILSQRNFHDAHPWPADAGSSLGVPNEPEAQAQLQPGKHRSHWIGGKIYRKPMGFSYEMDIFLLFFP